MEIFQAIVQKYELQLDGPPAKDLEKVARFHYSRLGQENGRKDDVFGVPITDADLNLRSLGPMGPLEEVTTEMIRGVLNQTGQNVRDTRSSGPDVGENPDTFDFFKIQGNVG
jgi:hypothetical protein